MTDRVPSPNQAPSHVHTPNTHNKCVHGDSQTFSTFSHSGDSRSAAQRPAQLVFVLLPYYSRYYLLPCHYGTT